MSARFRATVKSPTICNSVLLFALDSETRLVLPFHTQVEQPNAAAPPPAANTSAQSVPAVAKVPPPLPQRASKVLPQIQVQPPLEHPQQPLQDHLTAPPAPRKAPSLMSELKLNSDEDIAGLRCIDLVRRNVAQTTSPHDPDRLAARRNFFSHDLRLMSSPPPPPLPSLTILTTVRLRSYLQTTKRLSFASRMTIQS